MSHVPGAKLCSSSKGVSKIAFMPNYEILSQSALFSFMWPMKAKVKVIIIFTLKYF